MTLDFSPIRNGVWAVFCSSLEVAKVHLKRDGHTFVVCRSPLSREQAALILAFMADKEAQELR